MATTRIYHNGIIQTMDAQARYVEAVAVSGDTIAATGTEEEMFALKETATEVVDLKGKTMYPGFIDGHSHFLYSGISRRFFVDLNPPPQTDITSIEMLKTVLKEVAAKTPKGEWILGSGYDDSVLEEKRHPETADLDEVSTDHPIFVLCAGGHLGTCNSKALEIAGVDRNTPNPSGGVIRRNPDGTPNGVLEEMAAQSLVYSFDSLVSSPENAVEGLAFASDWYAAKGVTTGIDAGLFADGMFDIYKAGHKQGKLKIRVQLYPGTAITTNPPTGTGIAGGSTKSGTQLTDDKKLSLGAFKILADGSIQSYSAFLSEPYYKFMYEFEDGPLYRGYPTTNYRDLEKLVIQVHKEGWQIAIHGNGDDTIQMIIDAIEAAQKAYPRDNARHFIIHCQTVREDQLDRMQRLGIIPAFFNMHVFYWGDRHRDIFLGPKKGSRISPLKSALVRNMPYTLHSDDPVVPIDPLLAITTAVTRKTSSGKVLGPEQCISTLEALRGVTTWAAYQNCEENLKGSLEPGKLADMVILEKDPLVTEPDVIKNIGIVSTIVGDEVVFGGLP